MQPQFCWKIITPVLLKNDSILFIANEILELTETFVKKGVWNSHNPLRCHPKHARASFRVNRSKDSHMQAKVKRKKNWLEEGEEKKEHQTRIINSHLQLLWTIPSIQFFFPPFHLEKRPR